MKKIVLAGAFLLLAFTGNSSLKGSILVNTVSFADLPDKPVVQSNKTKLARTAKSNSVPLICSGPVKTLAKSTGFNKPVKWNACPTDR
ncbi:hypothetical protein [Adhaeribacter pallidiroseus]|uniref:Uncharacterized protein n=1 Tax=Adhaeribacter pallidiroseus TaxID=2072847 RepID=A0A369QE52_9BACT|nr:hypothetical protein [Adhaeribacter pallidiroseus]RDC63203.1 hypothetical protein AHMF7616_01804 [Adhaeribacter pallidiroseus]